MRLVIGDEITIFGSVGRLLPNSAAGPDFIELDRAIDRPKLMKQKPGTAPKELAEGQVWRMTDSHLHVGLVGKHLVHYKLIKGEAKRTSTSLSAKATVEQYLRKNKAVLVGK